MHMTLTTVPGAAVAPGAMCPRRLQEFFYKMGKDRSRLLTRGFSRSLITNMSSATIAEEPGAPGNLYQRHLQEFFFKIEEKPIENTYSGGFQGR